VSYKNADCLALERLPFGESRPARTLPSHDVLFRAILARILDFNSVFAQNYPAATKVELKAKEGEVFLDRGDIESAPETIYL